MTTTTDRPADEQATGTRPTRPPGRRPGFMGGRNDGIVDVFNHAFLVVWGLLTALPLLWAVLSSFKDDREILSDPWGLPARLRFDNSAFSLPFTVFFLTAFFRTLPTSVAEAALIDGCGHFGLFFRVMLPMAKPGLISVGIFNFLWQWNQYVLPVVLMQGERSQDKWVLAQGLAALAVSEGYAGDYSRLFAGLTIAMLPVLVVYVVFQRQVQAGLTAGHLK